MARKGKLDEDVFIGECSICGKTRELNEDGICMECEFDIHDADEFLDKADHDYESRRDKKGDKH